MVHPPSWRETRENLVYFNRFFQLRASRSDRQRFWHTYLGERRLGLVVSDAAAMARELEAATIISNRHFWAGRTPRFLNNNRLFRKIRKGAIRGHAVRDLPDLLVQRLLADPECLFRSPDAKLLKDSRTSKVALVPVPELGRSIIIKRFNVRSGTDRLKNLLRPSPALRSWLHGQHLLDRDLPTARPLALLQQRKTGIAGIGYVAFEYLEQAQGLAEAVASQHDRARLRLWIDRLARVLRLMHERDVGHWDLKAANILLVNDNPVLIDLVGVDLRGSISFKDRARQLARLNASFLQSSQVSLTDRLRFLRMYLNWNLHGRGDWKSWWRQIAAATRAKIAKNQRSGRSLA